MIMEFVKEKCPSCGAELAKEEPEGIVAALRRAPCPKCGRLIEVTEVVEKPAEPVVEPVTSSGPEEPVVKPTEE